MIVKKTNENKYLPNCPMTYKLFLPDFMAFFIMATSTLKEHSVLYSINYHKKLLSQVIISIKNPPSDSIVKLFRLGVCVYCQNAGVTNDHICTIELNNSANSLVPSCKSCNSSKGNKDLIDWWVVSKHKQIQDLSCVVIRIFCRTKYKILEDNNMLNEQIPYSYKIAYNQLIEYFNTKNKFQKIRCEKKLGSNKNCIRCVAWSTMNDDTQGLINKDLLLYLKGVKEHASNKI